MEGKLQVIHYFSKECVQRCVKIQKKVHFNENPGIFWYCVQGTGYTRPITTLKLGKHKGQHKNLTINDSKPNLPEVYDA